MTILTRYISYFLVGLNFYTAFVSFCLAIVTTHIFGAPHEISNSFFVFCCTLTAYNLHRAFKWRKGISHSFLENIQPNSVLQWLSIIIPSAIAALVFTNFLGIEQLLFIGIIGLFTSSYIFIHPIKKVITGLRYVPYLKTFLVSTCWTFLMLVLCIHSDDCMYQFNHKNRYALILFLQIWQACLIFDFRDFETDKPEVKTFAGNIQREFFALLILLLSIGIGVCLFTVNLEIYALIILIFSVINYLVCLYKIKNKILFTLLADGNLILMAVVNYLTFS